MYNKSISEKVKYGGYIEEGAASVISWIAGIQDRRELEGTSPDYDRQAEGNDKNVEGTKGTKSDDKEAKRSAARDTL